MIRRANVFRRLLSSNEDTQNVHLPIQTLFQTFPGRFFSTLTLLSLLLLLLLSLLHDVFLRHSVTLHLAFKGVRRFVFVKKKSINLASV